MDATAEARALGAMQVRGLSRRFGAKIALHPTHFAIPPGGVTALLGPNGSGKSTLLRCMLGLVRPDAGGATIDGVELSGDGTAVRERTTFAPGEMHLYTEMRGDEHLSWLLRGRERDALARARAMADQLGLPLRSRVRAYSHGMKRQLLFCAAMAPRVRVRILDEPSEGLDPSKRGAILELAIEDARRGTTILLSSHHLGEVDRASTRMLFLHQGKLVLDEDAAVVRSRAARTLRLEFGREWVEPSPRNESDLRAALELRGAKLVSLRGTRAVLELAQDDPRVYLAELANAPHRLPPPRGIEFGKLSLGELYSDLYGVEAV